MKKKIIAIACLAAMCINTTAAFAEEIIGDTIDNVQIEENINPNVDYIEENIDSDIINEIENNSDNEISTFAVDENKTMLDELIAGIEACSYEEVATEDTAAALKDALNTAKEVSEDENADAAAVSEAYNALKTASENMEYTVATERIGTTYSGKEDTKLSDGDKDSFVIYDTAVDGDFAEIVYDLGEKCYVTDVMLYSQYRVQGTRVRYFIKNYSVSISNDGTDYITVGNAESDAEGTGEFVAETKAAFPAAYARYVKITVYPGDNVRRFGISEIEVNGFKDPNSKKELYNSLKKCYLASGEAFTTESYKAYTEAYAAAERVFYDQSAQGSEVAKAKLALENAYAALVKRTDASVLTKNYSDKYYPGMSKDIIQGITYKNNESYNAQISTTDPESTKLFDATYSTSSSDGVCFGTWGAGRVEVVFDLSEEAYVSGVDVWEFFGDSHSATHIKTVEISVSDDGTDFTTVATCESDYNAATALAKTSHNISQDFDAVKCRYVKVYASTDTYQIDLNEVVIKGFRIKNQESGDIVFGTLDYTDGSGSYITTIDGQNVITVSGKITSKLADTKDITVITVAYKDNDIVAWDAKQLQVGAKSSIDFENTLNMAGVSGAEIRTFVWDSLQSGISVTGDKLFGSMK